MQVLRQYILIGLVIGSAINSSCNYRYYSTTDINGIKYRWKEYKTDELQQKYKDKAIVKYFYKQEVFIIDLNCLSKTDTSVECDSVDVVILEDSKEFASIFTKGILPCKILIEMYGQEESLISIDVKTGKEMPRSRLKALLVGDMHVLTFIKTAHTRKIIKFKVTPYTFYMELTNDNAKKRTKLSDFIKGSHLTWFYKASTVEI